MALGRLHGGAWDLWRPIPRDRDQALVRYDGALLDIARKVHPKLVNFGPEYPSVLGLAWNAQAWTVACSRR